MKSRELDIDLIKLAIETRQTYQTLEKDYKEYRYGGKN
jgi:hypothetical protein